MARNEKLKASDVMGASRRQERFRDTGFKGRQEVELTCDAPKAHEVFVGGSFNNWRKADQRLRRDETGIWKVSLWLTPGRFEYRFVVDDQWQDDPNALIRVPNGFGTTNCVLEVVPTRMEAASGTRVESQGTRPAGV